MIFFFISVRFGKSQSTEKEDTYINEYLRPAEEDAEGGELEGFSVLAADVGLLLSLEDAVVGRTAVGAVVVAVAVSRARNSFLRCSLNRTEIVDVSVGVLGVKASTFLLVVASRGLGLSAVDAVVFLNGAAMVDSAGAAVREATDVASFSPTTQRIFP